jgi:hypothetical protein
LYTGAFELIGADRAANLNTGFQFRAGIRTGMTNWVTWRSKKGYESEAYQTSS